MRTQKTRLGLLTLAFFSMLVATPGTYAQELVIAPGEPITVGVLTALLGGESDFGIASEHGVLLAHEERPSLRFGDALFPIELDRYDSACSDVEGNRGRVESGAGRPRRRRHRPQLLRRLPGRRTHFR